MMSCLGSQFVSVVLDVVAVVVVGVLCPCHSCSVDCLSSLAGFFSLVQTNFKIVVGPLNRDREERVDRRRRMGLV